MAKIFISYSHKDKSSKEKLEAHLSTLKREGVIEIWHDRCINPGDDFSKAISDALETSEIILLLVSADFLKSDYCYEIEMKRAIERYNESSLKVIPVILEPCDWTHAILGRFLALPTDGKPVSKFPNINDAYLEIVEGIRKIVVEMGNKSRKQPIEEIPISTTNIPQNRSSNLRIKKDYSDLEKDEFLISAFQFIKNFFENSLKELQKMNPEIKARFREIDTTHFTAEIYQNGNSASCCTIWLEDNFGNCISYSNRVTTNYNAINDSLRVVDDGHNLFLKSMFMPFSGLGMDGNDNLSKQDSAEYYWSKLIELLQ